MKVLSHLCSVKSQRCPAYKHTKLNGFVYPRRVNAGVAPATRDTIRKAYEFALKHIGQDKDSGSIWRDYIQLEAFETGLNRITAKKIHG